MSEKLFLFQRIKELADRQEDLLAHDRLEAFVSLLSQRSQIQRKIDQQKRLPGMTRGSKAGSLDLRIRDVIISIQETDRKIEEMILKQKSSLINEIKDLRHGKKAVKGYGGNPGRGPRYVDQHK